MAVEQVYVWDRLRAHAYGNKEGDREAAQRYFEQSSLKSLEEIYEIDLRAATWDEQAITESLGWVPACERLTIRHAWGLNRGCAPLLAQKSHTLQHLHLLYDGGFQQPLYPLAEQYPNLKTLEIAQCSVDDTTMESIAKQCPELCRIRLENCSGVTNENIKRLTATCTKLTSIDISSNFHYITADLLTIISECPNLTEIAFTRQLKMSWNPDEKLQALAKGCPHLKKICLRGRWPPLSDDTCHVIATNCHELAKLHFCCEKQPPLDEFVRFVRKIHVLTHVTFFQCHLLNDTALSVLATHHSHLRKITIHNCSKITNAGMIAIAKGCPELVSVVCQLQRRISDRTLFALATSCPHLAKLDFSFTYSITNTGIVMVAEKCHRLRDLDVTHTDVTREGIKKVWALRPYCEVMHTTAPTQDEISCLIS